MTLTPGPGRLAAIASIATIAALWSAAPGAAQIFGNPDDAPRPTASASRATGRIVVDGLLDEATWATAHVIDQFTQQKPATGMPSTERTEVRILFDDDHLYIGAELHDQPGYRPIIPTLQRDPNTRDGDTFGISFDPFLDGGTVLTFIFNPGGAVRDIQTADDGRINNAAWDAAFTHRVRVHDRGWTVEVAIPWSQLRFDASNEQQVWGMNILRRIRRKNEDAMWAPMDRQYQVYVSSRAGRLTGLDGLRPGRNLSIKPFALTSRPSGDLQAGSDAEFDAGLDLKYGLTPGMTLDLTANTDFSQVEVDQERVNLTRFSLFFPEKREFFLENAGIFQFGDQGTSRTRSGASNRDFTLFHSRRIGLTPRGAPLPILGGGRVSGTAGPVALGLLNMQTRSQGDFPAENFTVARVRGEPLRGLNVGGILVDRSETGGGVATNRSYGVDANLQAANGYLLVQSYLAATDGTAADGTPIETEMAGRLSVAWRDPFWEIATLYRIFDDEFDPGVGFVRRRGIQHGYGTVGVRPRVNWPGILELNPYVESQVYTDLGRDLQTRLNTVGLKVDFRNGASASFDVTDRYERVDDAFSVSGLQVQPGRYDFVETSASYTANAARAISGRLNLTSGSYFGGTRTSVGANLLSRIGHRLLLDFSVDHNEIELPSQGSTTADVFGAKLDLFMSTTLLSSAFVQYNEASSEMVTNLRFRWIHAPLSDLYLVLTERRDTAADAVLDRFLTVKFTRMVSF